MPGKASGRATSTGRIAVYADFATGVGAMIDLRCETAPVASNEHFVALANDLAKQLATGPGAATPDALFDQPSPSNKGTTLRQQFDDLINRIREVFMLERIVRVDGPPAATPITTARWPCSCRSKERQRPASWPATSACTSRP